MDGESSATSPDMIRVAHSLRQGYTPTMDKITGQLEKDNRDCMQDALSDESAVP